MLNLGSIEEQYWLAIGELPCPSRRRNNWLIEWLRACTRTRIIPILTDNHIAYLLFHFWSVGPHASLVMPTELAQMNHLIYLLSDSVILLAVPRPLVISLLGLIYPRVVMLGKGINDTHLDRLVIRELVSICRSYTGYHPNQLSNHVLQVYIL